MDLKSLAKTEKILLGKVFPYKLHCAILVDFDKILDTAFQTFFFQVQSYKCVI